MKDRETRDSQEARKRDERIAAAWKSCRRWFGQSAAGPAQGVYLLYTDLSLGAVIRAFREIIKRAESYYTGSVSADPDRFDPGCIEVEDCARQLEAGNLVAMSLQYQWKERGHLFHLLITVTKRGDDIYRAKGFTQVGLIAPDVEEPGEKFETLVRHAVEVEGMLEAEGVSIGPKGRGGAWVEV